MEAVSAAALLVSATALYLLQKLAAHLRKRFPARVNCWFCNTNSWVPYHLRNSWNCKKCEQYNGFLPDGSYNVVLDTRTSNLKNYNKNAKHLPSTNNGLCRKCNINQQLKIRQLSGFIPMNEKNFDAEVDTFKSHLEKIYSLCASCKKHVKQKLSSEKGLLLGTKLLDSRGKHEVAKKTQVIDFIKDSLKNTLKLVVIIFLVFVVYNIIINLDLFLSKRVMYVTKKYFKDLYLDVKNVSSPHINKAVDIFTRLTDGYNFTPTFIPQYSFLYTALESCSNYSSTLDLNKYNVDIDVFNIMDAITITGFVLQILIHAFDFNLSLQHIVNDAVWGFSIYISKSGIRYLYALQMLLAVILFLNSGFSKVKKNRSPKNSKNKLKHLSSNNVSGGSSDDDIFEDDSDSDSCSSIGSAREQNYFKSVPNSLFSFDNRKESASSPFSNNSQYKSQFNLTKDIMNKSYNFSQMNNRNEFELDKSIGSLSIGRQNNSNKNDPFFMTRQYNCTSPNIFMLSPTQFPKPILSPSRLTHGTQQSWVAGGYWGSDSPQLLYNMHETGSSSSQSSGFESLTSSMYRRNVNSFPPSREESVSSECEKRNDNFNGSIYNSPNSTASYYSFMPHKSPVYPSMKRNESIFIPSVPFDSNYSNCCGSAFAKPNPSKSFVPMSGPFSNSNHRSPP